MQVNNTTENITEKTSENITENTSFKPLIVAFCCNWCSYAGADLAGTNRLTYPADVKIIVYRVPAV